jgi:hypothetical protein
MGWWHKIRAEELKEAQAEYGRSVEKAKEVIKVVPTGSDFEIRKYLAQAASEDGDKVTPASIPDEQVKSFREEDLPEYKDLASGKLTQEQYNAKYDIKTSLSKKEEESEDNTVKGIFLLLLLSKSNLISLVAAAALAFKLSTNA